jgi:uncharacterized protein (TIGR02246 family)
MRGAIVVGIVAAALAAGGRVEATSPSNEGGLAGDVANERIVRELYDGFVAAWNRHDVEALAAMWAIDGDHFEPDGTVAKGRDAVRALLGREHGSVFAKTRLTLSVADVWFVSEEVALVDGGYEIHGIRTLDGAELPARRGHLTSVLIREQGKWWIAASRLMIPTELPYKPKQ